LTLATALLARHTTSFSNATTTDEYDSI
jgi:hypothetical protein